MSLVTPFLLYIWQLPQNLVGLLLLFLTRGETKHKLNDIRFYYQKTFPGGITLGEYILVGTKQEFHIRHEFGHVLQSRYLGPFYLLVIGIPSIIHASINSIIGCCRKHKEGYYHFYTEKWANKLANNYGRQKKKT